MPVKKHNPTSNGTATSRVRLKNAHGLHLRPAQLLSNCAQQFSCTIQVACGSRRADAKSILDLIGLAAEFDSELVFEAHGLDSGEALACLERLISNSFQVSCQKREALMTRIKSKRVQSDLTTAIPPVAPPKPATGALTPHDIVARRAFSIWQSHGCPADTALQDWLQAEAEVKADIRRGRGVRP